MTPGPLPDAPIERIRHLLVGLRMPRALETLDAVVQQIERGQISAIEAIDTLLAKQITVREGRRIMAALQMARLPCQPVQAGHSSDGVNRCPRTRRRMQTMADQAALATRARCARVWPSQPQASAGAS